jgi:oligopeptide transport system substrate-binding protein
MRPLVRLLFSLFSLLAAAGCAKRETIVERGNREGVLHVCIGYEPSELDPQNVTGIGEAQVIPSLFEALVSLDPVTQKTRPRLAESWETSADGLTYTFHLQPAAKWSNGEPLTGQDVVDAWHRILSPTLAADYSNMFYVIRGAEAFNKGQTKDFSTVGLAAPDAHTVVVTLERPTAYFLLLLDNSCWRPVNVRAIAKQGDPYQRGNKWTASPATLVTSGPFVMKEWTPHKQIVVEKSPTYWDREHVRLNSIVFYPIDSPEVEERNFRTGQLHIMWEMPLPKIAAYRRDHPELLRIDPYVDTFFFRFNTRVAPFNDQRVRRALSLAIDRESIARNILTGGQTPAGNFVHPGTPGYTPPPVSMHDLAEARRLLEAAGFPGGKGFPAFEIMLPSTSTMKLVCEAIQEMWRRDLGLTVNLQNQEKKVIMAERKAGHYQVLFYDWVGDYLDPTTFLDMWRADNGNNHTGWADAGYDAMLNQAEATRDPVARMALLQKAEARMIEAAPIAPVYFNPHVYLIQPSVKGWKPTASDAIDYKDVWLEP